MRFGAITLAIVAAFVAGSRFPAPGVEGVHPIHDTQTKRLRHLNFFQHECYLEIRTPRVKLPRRAGQLHREAADRRGLGQRRLHGP